MVLTARAVEAATAIAGKRRQLPDGKIAGLMLMIHPSGDKSWALYARLHGKRVKLTLGRWPQVGLADARALAAGRLKLIAQGIDPREHEKQQARIAQERKATTFEAVASDFITLYAKPRNRSWRETEQLLRTYATPVWGDWPLRDIERRHVATLIDGLGDRPATQRKVLAAVRKLFSWSLERELVDRNPARDIRAARGQVRERVLSDDELKAVWPACEAAGYPFGPFVRLLLLTGCRRGEMASATWPDIDRVRQVLLIPGGRYKTGKPHAVPLSEPAMAIVETLPRRGEHLFTTNGATPISGFSKMLKRLVTRSGVAFSLHDLRRTLRTNLSKLGVEHHVAERVLGHVQQGVAVHYDHYGYLAEKRHALNAWAACLRGILDETPSGNVVPLRGREP